MKNLPETLDDASRILEDIIVEEAIKNLEPTLSYSLGDALREGSKVTKQAKIWPDKSETIHGKACANTTILIALRARKLV